MNEPCRLCGSEPTLANYYDFYRLHCPTPGCREHLGDWVIVNGKGRWYGSIDEARGAWNTRQRRGEATSDPQTIEPEPEPAGAENEPQDASYVLGQWIGEQILKKRGESQDDSKRKTKKQLRAEAVERLDDCRYTTTGDLAYAMVGWGHEPHTGEELRYALIDLLADDEPMQSDFVNCGNPYRKGQAVLDAAIIRPMDAGRDNDGTCPNAIGHAAIDTREKLEADIAKWASKDKSIPLFARCVSITYDHLLEWLDRQAAIAERETLCQPDERDEQIAELTTERDEAYKRGYDDGLHANTKAAFAAAEQAFGDESAMRFEGGVIKSQAQRIRELEAERDHLRKVVKQQADSFAKLERELHDLNSGEELNALRASVAGLKSTVEKQAETIDNQRDELSRFNAGNHGTKRIPKGIRWPRHEDGKLVKICGLDAMTVKFDKTGCTIDYGFDQIERMSYDDIRVRERV